MQGFDGHNAGRSQQQEAPFIRRQKTKGAHGHAHAAGADDQREDKEGYIDADQPLEKKIRITEQAEEPTVFPQGTWILEAAIRADGFVSADEAAAVRAELGIFVRSIHMAA